ncbi:Aste57867_1207 [Aphanomyces stellatus]|uniref:Aste57867_1207 protein n=1 Tax=Aphanomyces stellatus TaxID=120398 RepID=A0A485K9R1_9STRA|nr:hypothetical protein As57867_001206 [Aphanomyces stellatus]VFT78427.1 Aste57867_1207 [Aphanomyces stellatus]
MCLLDDQQTCCFGIYKSNGTCLSDNTYASLRPIANNVTRVSFFVCGLVAFVACLRKRYLIHESGSRIQKQVYSLMLVASLTFVLRSLDPWSHQHIYPPMLSGLLTDVCTASLFSVMILFTAFYARLVILSTRHQHVYEHYLRGFTRMAFFLTWTNFAVVQPVYLSWGGFYIFRSWHLLVQHSMSSALLLIISTAAFYCGMQVHRRLAHIQELNTRAAAIDTLRQQATLTRTKQSPAVLMSMPRHPDGVEYPPPPRPVDDMPHPIFLHDNEEVDDDEDELEHEFFDDAYFQTPPVPRVPSPSTNITRVWKVTVLMEVFAIIAVGCQVTYVVQFIQRDCLEQDALSLSREGPMDKRTSVYAVPVFAILQHVMIWIVYWCFSKTKDTASDPLATTRSFMPLLDR